MARKSVGLPRGVELRGETLRIRFKWNGKRCSESLPYPATQAGIAAASRLRDQVAQLLKLGVFDELKYSELFPNSPNAISSVSRGFGQYAQVWLDSRSITEGTRDNYKSVLNVWWMPYLATTPLQNLTTALMRELVVQIPWTSDGVKANAMSKLGTILASAVSDKLITLNPMEELDIPERKDAKIDPFTQEEADRIIAKLYATDHWPSQIYAAFFEFSFYSGMRPGEIAALRWEEVNFDKRMAHVCRTVVKKQIAERTKTKKNRYVLLNDRALHALQVAKAYSERRSKGKGRITDFPYCFPPSKNAEYIQQTSDLHHQWRPTLKALGIRYRPPYNARHTYATMCLMAGMKPAFIAKQLGHSIQILLTRYARWLDGASDWAEMEKLTFAPKVPQA
ncbi:tyrosine-type recombinase/integrase [Pseudomonas sp. L-22-4S-12]|uniref:tyrosine-type recombinase/integrase n=1 Tax=Pseudomonas sp. L-22-4S-12 TaxID=2610893 RepID=UPI001324150B|nr:tyrosine-type recombinase/integrase [Pseudomonas sp. L-22-4S-12]MWV17515.1 tyrosine-type recombinase/integrase [Pseudomonas sp. L-22-4S-12]